MGTDVVDDPLSPILEMLKGLKLLLALGLGTLAILASYEERRTEK